MNMLPWIMVRLRRENLDGRLNVASPKEATKVVSKRCNVWTLGRYARTDTKRGIDNSKPRCTRIVVNDLVTRSGAFARRPAMSVGDVGLWW